MSFILIKRVIENLLIHFVLLKIVKSRLLQVLNLTDYSLTPFLHEHFVTILFHFEAAIISNKIMSSRWNIPRKLRRWWKSRSSHFLYNDLLQWRFIRGETEVCCAMWFREDSRLLSVKEPRPGLRLASQFWPRLFKKSCNVYSDVQCFYKEVTRNIYI